MISYATEFPIDVKNTPQSLLQLAVEWIKGSPHTRIAKETLKCPMQNCETKYSHGTELVTLCSVELQDYTVCGVRWVQIENSNIEWTTTIVGNKSKKQFLVSLQLSCEALSSAKLLPTPKKPLIIGKLLKELRGGNDGKIPVTDKPFMLKLGEENIAAALINGTAENRLPVIYISADCNSQHIVNPILLAKILSGLAHVVVEPNCTFSYNLKDIVTCKNVYGGTIGTYWPDINKRKSYFINNRLQDAEAIQNEIINDVRISLTNRRQTPDCTWLHLQEVLSTYNYTNLRSNADTELNELISAADAEIRAKLDIIRQRDSEIAHLYGELRKSNSQLQTPQTLLCRGVEQEFYEGEIHDLLISTLESGAASCIQHSRRAHIVSDILKHNKITGKSSEIYSNIKSLFKTYMEMDSKTRGTLEKLGFTITEDGKHFKALFHHDTRYIFALSKSAGDHRSGKNLSSDIRKKLF